MGPLICTGRVSRYMEGKYDGRIGSRGDGIRDSGEIFDSFKKGIWRGEEELVKAAKLRKLEQGRKTMEEFVQEFKRATRGSRYEGRPLMEEFKRGINGGIRRKLMESEHPPVSIEQWYKRVMALDRNWRKSRREKERIQGKKETGAQKQEKTILP